MVSGMTRMIQLLFITQMWQIISYLLLLFDRETLKVLTDDDYSSTDRDSRDTHRHSSKKIYAQQQTEKETAHTRKGLFLCLRCFVPVHLQLKVSTYILYLIWYTSSIIPLPVTLDAGTLVLVVPLCLVRSSVVNVYTV